MNLPNSLNLVFSNVNLHHKDSCLLVDTFVNTKCRVEDKEAVQKYTEVEKIELEIVQPRKRLLGIRQKLFHNVENEGRVLETSLSRPRDIKPGVAVVRPIY